MVNIQKQAGYTLIELLTVLSIFVVVGGIILSAWTTYYPTFAIEQAATKLASDINFAAFQAVTMQNQWLMIFLYPPRPGVLEVNLTEYPGDSAEGTWVFKPDAYLLANDDGWLGIPPRLYTIGDMIKFDWAKRGDGKMGRNEFISGPVRLGKNIDFYTNRAGEPTTTEFYSPERIIFKWDWSIECSRPGFANKRSRASLWLVDNHFRTNLDSHDNDLHRRRIKVRSNSRVEISLK